VKLRYTQLLRPTTTSSIHLPAEHRESSAPSRCAKSA
jgi:hypothetical protein